VLVGERLPSTDKAVVAVRTGESSSDPYLLWKELVSGTGRSFSSGGRLRLGGVCGE
jgi:hypothetical protein